MLRSRRVTIQTTPTLINAGGVRLIIIRVPAGAVNTILIGDENVSASTGFTVPADTSRTFEELWQDDKLYAIATPSAQEIQIFEQDWE